MPTRTSTRSGRDKPTQDNVPILYQTPDGPLDARPLSTSIDGAAGDEPVSASLPDVTLSGKPQPLADREARIAQAAYRRAEQRGFYPGHEVEDWLAAEKEIDAP